MEKNIEVSLLLDFYGELLKPAGRHAVDLYYNDDLSLSEIAEDTGITRQEEISALAGQIMRSTDDSQLRSLAAQIADKAGALKEKE